MGFLNNLFSMVDDNDDIDAAAIQSLVEIAQLNPTQARNALKHYGNSLENACNAFFNGSLQFTENDAIKLPDDIDIVDGEEEEEEDDDLVMIDGDGTDRRTTTTRAFASRASGVWPSLRGGENYEYDFIKDITIERAEFFVASVSSASSQPTVLSGQRQRKRGGWTDERRPDRSGERVSKNVYERERWKLFDKLRRTFAFRRVANGKVGI